MNKVSAAYASANQLFFPQSGAEMCLTVQAEVFESSSIWCRVVVRGHRLFIEEMKQADPSSSRERIVGLKLKAKSDQYLLLQAISMIWPGAQWLHLLQLSKN